MTEFSHMCFEKVAFFCVPLGNVSEAMAEITGDNDWIIQYGADLRDNWEAVCYHRSCAHQNCR